MPSNNVKIKSGNSQIEDHPMINGLVDLLASSKDLAIGHAPEYVLLTDTNAEVFYRFDKTENGYLLTVTGSN